MGIHILSNGSEGSHGAAASQMCLMTGSKWFFGVSTHISLLKIPSPGSICGLRAGFLGLYEGTVAMFTSLLGSLYLQDQVDKIYVAMASMIWPWPRQPIFSMLPEC